MFSILVLLVTVLVSVFLIWIGFALHSAQVNEDQTGGGFIPSYMYYIIWPILFVLIAYEATKNFMGVNMEGFGIVNGGYMLLLAWLVLGAQRGIEDRTRNIMQTGSIVLAGSIFAYYAFKNKRYHMLAIPAWLSAALINSTIH